MKSPNLQKYQFSLHHSHGPFHFCVACGKEWKTKKEFLHDRQIALSNYVLQKEIDSPETSGGVLVFVHKSRACGKFLKLSASDFRDRLKGPSICKTR